MADADIVHEQPNNDIVDRTFQTEELSPKEMQNRLINLYQTDIFEWKMIESHLKKGLLDQGEFNDQNVSNNYLGFIQKS